MLQNKKYVYNDGIKCRRLYIVFSWDICLSAFLAAHAVSAFIWQIFLSLFLTLLQ
jgi:hypothetical protein